MSEQMIEQIAREIIVHNRQMVGDDADYAYADQILASEDAGDAGEAFAARELARAAHSVIAGKVAELVEALRNARIRFTILDATATLQDQPEVSAKIENWINAIDAALAPYPERR